MQGLVIREFGPPTVFHQETLPMPHVRPGHVIVQIKASSVNQIDCKIRAGLVPEIAPALPAILHGDVAGVVTEVGPEVKGFKKGDEVYACAGGVKGTGGALAEYMLVDADCLALKPKTLTFTQAAALPLVTITAWTALFLRAGLKKGQTLLVHGGVGGVGHIGVQLGKWCGAKVSTTVGSEEDFILAKQLGAEDVINFRSEGVVEYVKRITEGRGFDVVFDTVGGKNLDLSFQAAGLNGKIVTTAARFTTDLTPMHNKGLSLDVVFMLIPLVYNQGRKEQGEILRQAATLVDQGKLIPLIDEKQFLVSDVASAHAYLESGKARGKVVLEWVA